MIWQHTEPDHQQECPQMDVTGTHWWQVNIASGNVLLSDSTKQLGKPVLAAHYRLWDTCRSSIHSMADENIGGPGKNMWELIKILYVILFEI